MTLLLGLVTGNMPAADDPAFHGSTAGLVTVRQGFGTLVHSSV
jgi:hypothetical protein